MALIQTPGFYAIGICVLIHSLGTVIAGLYPMDRNYQVLPNSATHRIHTAAEMLMSLSLLAAQLIGVRAVDLGWGFQWFSLTTAILSVYFSLRIFPAAKMQKIQDYSSA